MAALAATAIGSSLANAASSAIGPSIQSNTIQREREARESAYTENGLPRYMAYGNNNPYQPSTYQHLGGTNYARTGYMGSALNTMATDSQRQLAGIYSPSNRRFSNVTDPAIEMKTPSVGAPPTYQEATQSGPPSVPDYGQQNPTLPMDQIKRMYWNS